MQFVRLYGWINHSRLGYAPEYRIWLLRVHYLVLSSTLRIPDLGHLCIYYCSYLNESINSVCCQTKSISPQSSVPVWPCLSAAVHRGCDLCPCLDNSPRYKLWIPHAYHNDCSIGTGNTICFMHGIYQVLPCLLRWYHTLDIVLQVIRINCYQTSSWLSWMYFSCWDQHVGSPFFHWPHLYFLHHTGKKKTWTCL